MAYFFMACLASKSCLSQDTRQGIKFHVVAGVAGDCYAAGLERMLELAMAVFGFDVDPAVGLDRLDDVADFNSGSSLWGIEFLGGRQLSLARPRLARS